MAGTPWTGGQNRETTNNRARKLSWQSTRMLIQRSQVQILLVLVLVNLSLVTLCSLHSLLDLFLNLILTLLTNLHIVLKTRERSKSRVHINSLGTHVQYYRWRFSSAQYTRTGVTMHRLNVKLTIVSGVGLHRGRGGQRSLLPWSLPWCCRAWIWAENPQDCGACSSICLLDCNLFYKTRIKKSWTSTKRRSVSFVLL